MTPTDPNADPIPQSITSLPIQDHFKMINEGNGGKLSLNPGSTQLTTQTTGNTIVWESTNINPTGTQVILSNQANPGVETLGNTMGEAQIESMAQTLLLEFFSSDNSFTVQDIQGFYLTAEDNGLVYFMASMPSSSGSGNSPKQKWKFRKATIGHGNTDSRATGHNTVPGIQQLKNPPETQKYTPLPPEQTK
ncbi:MAG: hypothetical protein JXR19_03540 [Bacteroidia bacterium]